MFIMQSTFSIFKLTKDGKAVMMKQDIQICSTECVDFLVSIANGTVESTGSY
jgi:hypothetical protein